MVCCPVSTRVKGYEFEVPINENGVTGVIQADQVRTMDLGQRKARYICTVAAGTVYEVQARIIALITK